MEPEDAPQAASPLSDSELDVEPTAQPGQDLEMPDTVPEAQLTAGIAAIAATDAEGDAVATPSAEPSARITEDPAADQPEATENGHEATRKVEASSEDARYFRSVQYSEALSGPSSVRVCASLAADLF